VYIGLQFVVEDVVQVDRFVLKSDTGSTLLEDICTNQVETVIPREPRTPICILNGRRKGRVGELVEKNRKKETAVVKLPDGGVFELSYDDICEFVGDPEDYY
jgi:ribosomal protein S4E